MKLLLLALLSFQAYGVGLNCQSEKYNLTISKRGSKRWTIAIQDVVFIKKYREMFEKYDIPIVIPRKFQNMASNRCVDMSSCSMTDPNDFTTLKCEKKTYRLLQRLSVIKNRDDELVLRCSISGERGNKSSSYNFGYQESLNCK